MDVDKLSQEEIEKMASKALARRAYAAKWMKEKMLKDPEFAEKKRQYWRDLRTKKRIERENATRK